MAPFISIPTSGDLVVKKNPDELATSLRYGVSVYEGLVQFTAKTNNEACGLAQNYARHHGVDVWTEAYGHLSCLSRFRPS
jgi:hypothetical protein